MFATTQSKNKRGKYDRLEQRESSDDDDEGVLSRYRVVASGPFPAMCDCTFHQLDDGHSKLMEACVVGGVLWKLQHFCRLQQRGQDTSKFWRTHAILLFVYVFSILCLGMLLDGGKPEEQEGAEISAEEPTEEEEENNNRFLFGAGLLVITALYVLMLVFLGAGLWISQAFRTKLETFVQEISEQLEPLGLKLALDNRRCCWLSRFSHIHISLKKRTSQPVQTLPHVTPEFQKWIRDQPVNEVKVTLESILYYGGHKPSLSNTRVPQYPLPVDDWIAGGLMMRLRKDRLRASICSRFLAILVFIPVGVLSILHLGVPAKEEAEGEDFGKRELTNLHNFLVALAITAGLTIAYLYFREFLDGSALHAVSRSVVKQFAGLAKERHDISLQYEVQPGDCLPRTTRGVIRFHPDSMAVPDTQKKKAKATLAFV